MVFFRCIVLSLLFITNFNFGNDSTDVGLKKGYQPYPVKLNADYAKAYYYDSKDIVTAPFHWKKKQWLTFGSVMAITTGLYITVDQPLQDWVNEEKTIFTQNLSTAVEVIGNGRYPVFTSALLYGVGALIKREKPKRIALLGIEGYLISGISAQIMKFMTNRHRPWSGSTYDNWEGPQVKDIHASFFSGHSSTVFAFATVFAMEYSDKKWVGALSYTLAGLSSLSRIHDNAHWASDVFLGSAVGYFMTRRIVKNHRDPNEKGVSFVPMISPTSNGLSLQYKF